MAKTELEGTRSRPEFQQRLANVERALERIADISQKLESRELLNSLPQKYSPQSIMQRSTITDRAAAIKEAGEMAAHLPAKQDEVKNRLLLKAKPTLEQRKQLFIEIQTAMEHLPDEYWEALFANGFIQPATPAEVEQAKEKEQLPTSPQEEVKTQEVPPVVPEVNPAAQKDNLGVRLQALQVILDAIPSVSQLGQLTYDQREAIIVQVRKTLGPYKMGQHLFETTPPSVARSSLRNLIGGLVLYEGRKSFSNRERDALEKVKKYVGSQESAEARDRMQEVIRFLFDYKADAEVPEFAKPVIKEVAQPARRERPALTSSQTEYFNKRANVFLQILNAVQTGTVNKGVSLEDFVSVMYSAPGVKLTQSDDITEKFVAAVNRVKDHHDEGMLQLMRDRYSQAQAFSPEQRQKFLPQQEEKFMEQLLAYVRQNEPQADIKQAVYIFRTKIFPFWAEEISKPKQEAEVTTFLQRAEAIVNLYEEIFSKE